MGHLMGQLADVDNAAQRFLEEVERLCTEQRITANLEGVVANTADTAVQAIIRVMFNDRRCGPADQATALAHAIAILLQGQHKREECFRQFIQAVMEIMRELDGDTAARGAA